MVFGHLIYVFDFTWRGLTGLKDFTNENPFAPNGFNEQLILFSKSVDLMVLILVQQLAVVFRPERWGCLTVRVNFGMSLKSLGSSLCIS